MLNSLSKHTYWLGGAVVIIFGILIFINKDIPTDSVQASATVQQGDIANRVLVFGKAQPKDVFELSFDVGGKLTTYPLSEGDIVTKGQVVAKLDGRTISADIGRAQSNIVIEQSRLSQLAAPISAEDQATQESRIEKQELQTLGAKQDFEHALDETIEDFHDLVEDTIDQHYLYGDEPTQTVFRLREARDLSPEQRETMTESRVLLELGYIALREEQILTQQYQDLKSLMDYSLQLSQEIGLLLDEETSVVAENIQDELEQYRDEVRNLYADLNAPYTAWQTAEEELVVLQRELAASLVGADIVEIDLQQSVINSKQAELSSLYTDLSRLTLKSPVSGRVFEAPLTNYQTVSSGQTVVSVVLDEPLVVKADVAESDVAFVSPGNKVVVSFDALDSVEFAAVVREVNNRENIGETIPTYESTFVFEQDQDLSSIRSGMTANIMVESGKKEQVLYIPSRFVVDDRSGHIVMVQNEQGAIIKRQVVPGVRTNTGEVEITSGLKEGETVVITK